jgi:mRNA interferase RelE/StbE
MIARLVGALKELEATPRPSGAKKLTDQNSCWRVRVGDFRIVYRIDDARQLVDVIRIAHRGDVYR